MADERASPLIRSARALSDVLLSGDAEALVRRPAPEEWSAWDVAYHVAQLEVWYLAKLSEAAGADAPDAMARYVGVWRAMREHAIGLAGAVPDERMDQVGLLGGVPDWTPRQLIERMVAHDEEHTAQALAALCTDETTP